MDHPAASSHSKRTVTDGDIFTLESLLEIEGGRGFAPDDNEDGGDMGFHHPHPMAPVSTDTASPLSEYLSKIENENKMTESVIPGLQDPIIQGAWFQLESHTPLLMMIGFVHLLNCFPNLNR
jgi:hypothetical protein